MTLGWKRGLTLIRVGLRILPAFLVLAAVATYGSAAALAAGQTTKPAAKDTGKAFVGTWTASFKGTRFLTLSLAMTGAKLSGSLSHAAVAWDDNGNIASAQPQPGSKPIAIGRVEGATLYFGSTTDHPMHMALKLTDKTHAELSILNSPPGSPALKPIEMVRDQQKP